VQRHVPGRTDVQCRERWVNVLDPGVNCAPWTPEVTPTLSLSLSLSLSLCSSLSAALSLSVQGYWKTDKQSCISIGGPIVVGSGSETWSW
jgi:hypothetical protein